VDQSPLREEVNALDFRLPIPLLRRLVLLWVVALTPLLVWFASFEMFEHPKQLALKLAAAAIALAAALEAKGTRSRESAEGTWPALPVILAISLVSVLASPLPRVAVFGEYASYQGWLHWLGLAVLLTSLATLLRKNREVIRFLAAVTISLTMVAAYALVQPLELDPVSWSFEGPVVRAFSTAGNPLYLGFLLAAGFPAVLGLVWSLEKPGFARVAGIAASGVVAAGVLASGSRSALAGTVVGGALFLWLMRRDPGTRGTTHGVLIVCLVAALLAPALLPSARNPFPLLMTRLMEVVRGEDSRPQIWIGAARLIRRAPLLGSGLDTFATLHHSVRTPALWRYLWRGSPENAHNEFIQVTATIGILGAGCVLWLLVSLVRIAAVRSAGRPLPAAAASGLLALAVPAMFGFVTCGSQVVGITLAAILLAQGRARPLPRWIPVPLAAILTLSLLVHLRFATADVALKSSVRRNGEGISSVLALDASPWAQRLLQAGFGLEQRWFGKTIGDDRGGSGRGPADRLATLEAIYRAALKANPLVPVAHANLARIAMRAGKTEEALAGYSRARKMTPTDAYLTLEHAQAYASAGRRDDAIAALVEIERLYPDFAEAPGLIGYLCLDEGDAAGAESALERSLDLNWHGNFGAAYAAAGNLAKIYHESGRETDARAIMLRARQFAAKAQPR
jgi:O-antigen ligase/Flp pilus assembly protein TadD